MGASHSTGEVNRMQLKIYPRLNQRSKKAMLKQTKRWGHSYNYYPRERLIQRLQQELNMTRQQVLSQIYEEREFLLKHRQYFI